MEDLKVYRVLMKVLSHKVRTPLSVVMNDLSYYDGLLPDEECDRPLRRCREIADLLSYCSLPQGRQLTVEERASIVSEVFSQEKPLSFPCKDGASLFDTACSECRTLLVTSFVENSPTIARRDNVFVIRGIPRPRVREGGPFDSLSALTSDYDIESLSAPLIDLIFKSYGTSIFCATTSDSVLLQLSLEG